MRIDFSKVEDVESYVSIPEGTYVCSVAEVRVGVTRDGSPRWAIRLEVAEGELAGRTAAWDGLTWSDRGMPRTKEVLANLGFDVSGILEIEASDLLGLRIVASFLTEEYEHPTTGRREVRLRVPYRGYASVEGGEPPGIGV